MPIATRPTQLRWDEAQRIHLGWEIIKWRCFMPLRFEVVCHIAMHNWNRYKYPSSFPKLISSVLLRHLFTFLGSHHLVSLLAPFTCLIMHYSLLIQKIKAPFETTVLSRNYAHAALHQHLSKNNTIYTYFLLHLYLSFNCIIQSIPLAFYRKKCLKIC